MKYILYHTIYGASACKYFCIIYPIVNILINHAVKVNIYKLERFGSGGINNGVVGKLNVCVWWVSEL